MKNVQNFVTDLVKIDYVEQSDCFGHYPFQMFVEKKEGGFELNALALGGNVNSNYLRFREYLKAKAKRIYLSLDFPAGGDIENDFVAIFSYENGKYNLFAIPYETQEGKTFLEITKSEQLDKIFNQFLKAVE